MTQINKISPLLQQQFPDFFIKEGPEFIEFIEAYYEWLEQQDNAIYGTSKILSYRDIDDTLEEFISYFVDEFIPSIPKKALGDKRTFIKYAINLYRAKGSEASYKLLFRLIYNEDITLYYPTEDILRVSDGRWVEETSIRIGEPSTGVLDDMLGQEIRGLESGATAIVDRLIRAIESGLLVREAFLIEIDGTFRDGETVTNDLTGSSLIEGTVVSFTGSLFDVDPITFRGSGHQSGDRVTITGSGGAGANGTILEVASNSAITFSIANGGSGYRVGEETVTIGGPGQGANFKINGIINKELISVATDQIEPVRLCTLNTTPYFISDGSNTAAVSNSFATANVTSNIQSALEFSNVEVGTIGSITVLNNGSGYFNLPDVRVFDNVIFRLRIPDGSGNYKGDNATITSSNVPGSIIDIRIDEPGNSAYSKNRIASIQNISRANTTPAKGLPNVTGVRNYAGKYIDTKGFLSWNPRLQDNYFYQKFSYVINVSQNFTDYKKFTRGLLHPGGTKLFGNYIIDNVLDANSQYTAANTITQFSYKFTKGTGTISVSNGSVDVTGNGTLFDTELSNGGNIKILSGLYQINTISSNTSMTLKTSYEANTTSNTTFYYANNMI